VVALVGLFVLSAVSTLRREIKDAALREELRINQEEQLARLNEATGQLREALKTIMQVDRKLERTQESVEEIKQETVPSGRASPPEP
jgi:hypothetical protein